LSIGELLWKLVPTGILVGEAFIHTGCYGDDPSCVCNPPTYDPPTGGLIATTNCSSGTTTTTTPEPNADICVSGWQDEYAIANGTYFYSGEDGGYGYWTHESMAYVITFSGGTYMLNGPVGIAKMSDPTSPVGNYGPGVYGETITAVWC
jgi:hypothetical protein